jgi:glycopeptide antibiotics resistance protein
LIGFLITLGLEMAQLMIVGRFTSSTDVILGFTGVAAGVMLMHLWRGTSSQTNGTQAIGLRFSVLWLLGAFAYVAFLAVMFWAPFDFTSNIELIKSRLNSFVEVPFAHMHGGSDTTGLFGAMRKVLWFIPLGVLCGITMFQLPTSVPRWLVVGISTSAMVLAALAIELGQVLLPERTADSTDFLLSAVGGVAGLWVAILIFGRSPT